MKELTEMFLLSNDQRRYFGLDPIGDTWIRKDLPADRFRPPSTLYFDGNMLKRHIVSTDTQYEEHQLEEPTRNFEIFLPKTAKGKEKKISPATLETKTAINTYCLISNHGKLVIGNYSNQRTFYSSHWERLDNQPEAPISEWVQKFIDESPATHLDEIKAFSSSKRKNHKFRAGDYFRFKLNRTEFGYGRILLDIHDLQKRALLNPKHGIFNLMGRPVVIRLYAFKTTDREIDLNKLHDVIALPSDYIMDNRLFYGDFEIVGHQKLIEDDFDFPITYSKSLHYGDSHTFLQWGLIHLELPLDRFNKYLQLELGHHANGHPRIENNPYSSLGLGVSPKYDSIDIQTTIKNGYFSFEQTSYYRSKTDLRNPANQKIKSEIFKAFGLDDSLSYFEATKRTKSINVMDVIDG